MAVAVSTGFVGRAPQLARLLAALERAEQGQPAMVLVAGDAGVGKTRLLAELADQACQRGTQVLVGGCLQVGDVGLPYVPVIAALRNIATEGGGSQLLAAAAKGLPGLGRLLPELADQATTIASAGEGLDQLQLFDAVGSLLLRLSEPAPVVLMLEDLHWADPSTRDLLAFLYQTLRVGRVLVVASYRSDELHRGHPLRPWLAQLGRRQDVEHIELAPFNRSELAEHLAAVRGESLPAAALNRILVRSQGNPFYAEELLAAGADRREVMVPPGLAEVLLDRVEALSDAAQQVLRAAAVAGRQVGYGVLLRVVQLPEGKLEPALREAIGARVLIADAHQEAYAFRHALIQEALYGDLLPSERLRLHGAYAQLLAEASDAGVGQAAELAHHCLASHDLGGALAASIQAADQAAAAAAPAEVLRHLEQLLALWERVPQAAAIAGDRVDLLLRAADAAKDSGDRDRAIAFTREALQRVDATAEPLRAAAAHERLGQYLIDAKAEQALVTCRQAVELVPDHPPTPLRARVCSTFSQALREVGRHQEARLWCEQALAVARAAGSAEDEAEALTTLALLERRAGRLGEAFALYATARSRAADAGHSGAELRAIFNLAHTTVVRGDPAAAVALLREGTDLAAQTGLAWSPQGALLRGLHCAVLYIIGDWDESERLAATFDVEAATPAQARLSSWALGVEVGRGLKRAAERIQWITTTPGADRTSMAQAAGYGADLACWQGDLDAARASIDEALEVLRLYGNPSGPVISICSRGVAAEADRAERARAAGADAELIEARTVGRRLLDQARAAAGAVLDFGELADVAEIKGYFVKTEAEWTRLEGRSNPERWQAAVEAFSYGFVYEVARCRWRLAEALLGSGDRERAAAAARAAYQTAVRLGAGPLRATLEALARRARLDLGTGAPQAPSALGLTPRELEVLRLLAAGRSNRQIAEQLFISGKTASVHVTNILAKLGVHSRLEAAARARELGLDRPADHSRP